MLSATSPKQYQRSFPHRGEYQCMLSPPADCEDKGTVHYRLSRHRFSLPACLNKCRENYVDLFVGIWFPDDCSQKSATIFDSMALGFMHLFYALAQCII